MRKSLLFLVLILSSLPATAQDTPRAELFLGYSALMTPPAEIVINDPPDSYSLRRERSFINGWNAAATVNVNSWLAFSGDFSGHYGHIGYKASSFSDLFDFSSDVRVHHFLVGPQFASNKGTAKVFFRGLIGGVHFYELSPAFGSILDPNGFGLALGAGGGVDYRINERMAWRIFQVDYLWYRFGRPKLVVNNVTLQDSVTQNNFRISTGFVFKN
ncbi:MAG: hypothetical protein EBU88_00815 [Acidobacteria bacterium]|nr:hypothetical protein [Acidobacteriota bacterium]